MSLGALAFLVGNQIGKTQKSTYERNLEEEKKKEERKIQAQINQELRQFDLDILKEQEKAKIDIAKQKELGIFKVTEEKTAGILTDLMMLDEETAVIQARKLAELEVINNMRAVSLIF
jgi:nucleosome binding factor SPN SPT16 subunit